MLPTMNIGVYLTQAATRFPFRTGVIDGTRLFPWSEVNSRVDRLAHSLRELGLVKGDRIVVQARNSHRSLEFKWAIFKLGAVWYPSIIV